MGIYVELWSEGGFQEMASDFNLGKDQIKELQEGFEIIHACYLNEDYSGEAFVIARSRADGSLFEVNACHCSCNGLEAQWEMESTDIDSLIHRHQAKALLGIDQGSGASWLRSMECERELSKSIQAQGRKPKERAQSL